MLACVSLRSWLLHPVLVCERDHLPQLSNTGRVCQRLAPTQSQPASAPRSEDGDTQDRVSVIGTYQEDSEAASIANTHSVDEKILRLQVSVQDVSTVTESEAFQQLVHE